MFQAAVSGIKSAFRRLDVTSNNIANSNSEGFNPDRVINQTATGGGTRSNVESTNRVLPPERTGRSLDLYVPEDDVFFRARQGNDSVLIKGGSLGLDGEGQLVHQPSGAVLEDSTGEPIRLPADAESVSVSRQGEVTFQRAGTRSSAGQLNTVSVRNPEGLNSEGSGLFTTSPNSGSPESEATTVLTGVRPGSGTNLAREITQQIQAEHAGKFAIEVFQVQSEMTGELLDQMG